MPEGFESDTRRIILTFGESYRRIIPENHTHKVIIGFRSYKTGSITSQIQIKTEGLAKGSVPEAQPIDESLPEGRSLSASHCQPVMDRRWQEGVNEVSGLCCS